MKTAVTTITPENAERYLRTNTNNFRTVSPAVVAKYAAEMRRGEWQLNGEAIKFSGGKLVDGQHRLHAIIEADCPIKTLVVNLDPASLNGRGYVGDEGLKRTVPQHLMRHGIKSARNKAAAARLILLHRRGHWGKVETPRLDPITNTEMVDFVLENDQRMTAVQVVTAPAIAMVSVSILNAIVFEGTHGDPQHNETAVWFCKSLKDGVGLEQTDAVLHLRNRMLGQKPGQRITPYMRRILTTLAWNKTVSGEECRTLKFSVTGPRKHVPPNEILSAQ